MNAQRRSVLKIMDNPDSRHDYVIDLCRRLADATLVLVRYIPDRDVLTPASFASYLDQLENSSLEALGLMVIEDLSNEVVPRWVEVVVERDQPFFHRVSVEDRQPSWDNPKLMARIPVLSSAEQSVGKAMNSP